MTTSPGALSHDTATMAAGLSRTPLTALIACVLGCAMLVGNPIAAADYPPTPGTDRDSVAYFDAVESFLNDLDLDDESFVFERLGGTTATNWAVKKDGEIVADLKCTSGNTDHHGAVIAYRLGRELGFDIYPVAVYRNLNREIDGRSFNEQCALKEWASVFTQYYWTRETFEDTDSQAKKELINSLKCQGSKPGSKDSFLFSANSAYGDPKIKGSRRVKYQGNTDLLSATKDFSNMMVIDTLIGNEDRFPGGNTFFRSVTTNAVKNDDGFVFENVRLFSLDNEAAFKGRTPASTHSAKDLKLHVWRFDSSMIDKLRRLRDDQKTLERITDGHEELSAFIQAGIQLVLEHVSEAEKTCGKEAVFF